MAEDEVIDAPAREPAPPRELTPTKELVQGAKRQRRTPAEPTRALRQRRQA
jgi:hypothetical protein